MTIKKNHKHLIPKHKPRIRSSAVPCRAVILPEPQVKWQLYGHRDPTPDQVNLALTLVGKPAGLYKWQRGQDLNLPPSPGL